MSMIEKVQELKERGVVVLPVTLSAPFNIDLFMNGQKEFIQPDGRIGSGLVLGGFGAYGHPSSFHHPEIRRIRTETYHQVKPFLTALREIEHLDNIEMLFDRYALRRKGTKPTREAWHRDVSPKKAGDIVLGGWVNLDTEGDQWFSCVPGTHIYSQQSLAQSDGFVALQVESGDIADKTRVQIPPNHIIMFYQDILHEIYPVMAKKDSSRLYTGWRITNESSPLFTNTQYVIERQATSHLPSGQIPPLFSKSHMSFHKHLVVDFAANIRSEYKNHPQRLYGGFPIEFRSIKEMSTLYPEQISMFPAYTSEEAALYFPHP